MGSDGGVGDPVGLDGENHLICTTPDLPSPLLLTPDPCPRTHQVPSLTQARLGTQGQFNNISEEVGSPGMGTTLLQETFPALTAPLRQRNRGGSSPEPGNLRG